MRIVGSPVACASGIKRYLARDHDMGEQAATRSFWRPGAGKYCDLFDSLPLCRRARELAVIIVAGEMLSSGGKVAMPLDPTATGGAGSHACRALTEDTRGSASSLPLHRHRRPGRMKQALILNAISSSIGGVLGAGERARPSPPRHTHWRRCYPRSR